MNINVNGKTMDYQPELTLHDLILTLKLNPDLVVVELNQEIVLSDKFISTKLSENDTLELLQFVGGG